ncbi:hypothetical protein BH11BAC4_BH11BAC4_18780 [soil metagenome]
MGKFEKGILGHFDGKVGTVVGSRWKGIDYMKSKSRRSTKPKTAKQLQQQAKFATVTKFVGPLGKLMKDSFNDPKEKMTGVNLSVSLNYANAVTGDYPLFTIDYGKVLVSKGTLHNVFSPAATANGAGKVKFDWTKNEGANASPDDIAVMVAYCPAMNQGIFEEDGSTRESEKGMLDTLIFTGKEVHTWLLFYTKNRDAVAASLYTGKLTVS